MAKSLLTLLLFCLSLSTASASEITIIRSRSETEANKGMNTRKARKENKRVKKAVTPIRMDKRRALK